MAKKIEQHLNFIQYLLKRGYNQYIKIFYKDKTYDFSDISEKEIKNILIECDFEIIFNKDGTYSLKDLQEINLADIENEVFDSFKEILERLEDSYLRDYFIVFDNKKDVFEYILNSLGENIVTNQKLYEKYNLYDGDVRNLIKRIANDDKKLIELNEKFDFISNPELNKEQLNKLFTDFVYPEIEINSFYDLLHHGDTPDDLIGNKLKQQIVGFLTKNNLNASSITNEELANLSKGKDKEIKQFLQNLSLMQELKKEITTLLNKEEWIGNEEKIIDNSITNLIKLAVSTKQINNTLDFLLVSDIQLENSTETWIEIIRPTLANELKIDKLDVDKKYFNEYFEPEIVFDELEI